VAAEKIHRHNHRGHHIQEEVLVRSLVLVLVRTARGKTSISARMGGDKDRKPGKTCLCAICFLKENRGVEEELGGGGW